MKWSAVASLLWDLLVRARVEYQGAMTMPSDFRAVYSRWRRNEPLLDGPYIQQFEAELAWYHTANHAITFGAGRMALYAILKALECQPDGEVILPGYTCVVTSNAIRFAGLRPVYVDVSAKDFNLLPEAVRDAITPRTCAVIAQHTFGIPCDLDALDDICGRYGVSLIEDGAHAMGARWKGCPVGTFGRAAFFSTQLTKMISTERGGYVVTNDDELGARVRDIQDASVFREARQERASLICWLCATAFSGRPTLAGKFALFRILAARFRLMRVSNTLEYASEEYFNALNGIQSQPYPCRMPNLLAYAGLLQLQRLDEEVARRQEVAQWLEKRLPACGAEVATYDSASSTPSWVRFPMLVEDRETWAASMRKAGLTPGYWLNDPIHPVGSNSEKALYTRGSCPVAENISTRVLNIPIDRRVSYARLDKWLKSR